METVYLSCSITNQDSVHLLYLGYYELELELERELEFDAEFPFVFVPNTHF